jgi:hypothetical protein
MTLGTVTLASGAFADGLSKADALNMKLLGHSDAQNRPIYQPTVHKYPAGIAKYGGHMILFAGLHAGSAPNPLNSNVVENNGTLIVDVTNPTHPEILKHLPPDNPANNSAQMVRVCSGQAGKLGQTGHVYMLRTDGSGGGNGQHDVYDVTDPVHPLLLSVPVSGLTATHKSWWECETGIAYIVAGAGAAATNPDGWTTNQHMKIFDLSDPAHPVYIRDIGLLGQNPGSSVTTDTSGVHGPQSVITNEFGETVNRVYIPYGTSSDGVLNIDDRLKILPNFITSAGQHIAGTWVPATANSAVAPTDQEMRDIVVGDLDMTPSEGGHSACPVYNMPLQHFKGFTSYTVRDYVQLISEETGNLCTGAPHFGYMVDATRAPAGSSSGEQHPMVVSTMQVFEDSAKPDYCTRGTRFGTHSCNEVYADPPSTFHAPYQGKLTFISYFDGGARAFDIRDPYHPKDVAHYVPPVCANVQPTVVNGVSYRDVSSNNLEVDSSGLIYDVDRLGCGIDILMLTGPAAAIANQP